MDIIMTIQVSKEPFIFTKGRMQSGWSLDRMESGIYYSNFHQMSIAIKIKKKKAMMDNHINPDAGSGWIYSLISIFTALLTWITMKEVQAAATLAGAGIAIVSGILSIKFLILSIKEKRLAIKERQKSQKINDHLN